MHKKAFVLALAGVSAGSVAAVAVGVNPPKVKPAAPAAARAVAAQAQAAAAVQAAPAADAAVLSSIARWTSLRQTDSLPFSSYASFVMGHRGWPGETAMRRSAEKAQGWESSPREVVAFFSAFPPLTSGGHARHAVALSALGQAQRAQEAARRAWTGGVLPRPEEERLLAQFGSALTQADHDARMESLLGTRDTQSAGRTLPLASAATRPLFEARLALQTEAPDAAAKLAAAGPVDGHAGLLMDRAAWLRGTGRSLAARQLLAQPYRLATRPADPATWFETLLANARAAANDNQWTTAYQIAAQIDQAYPAGTDVSERSYAERDHYTSLVWLGGMAALDKLGRPADAARLFERYARAARSPQTRSKGFYWAARAAHAAGQAAQSNALLEEAAASPDQYYGQLALERLDRPLTPPSRPAAVTARERAAFSARPLVQATRAMGEMGRWSDQSLFVRALAENAASERERFIAAEYGRAIGRQDLGVWVAREARSKGENFYSVPGFPEVSIPGAYQQNWAVAHGIARQESSFDRQAVSHAGARGMMQLMPPTAREEAGKLGIGYEFGRLTSDPSYNLLLGSSYYQRLLDQWDGYAPLAVASYNAGAGNVRRWVRANGDPRTSGVDVVQWIEEIPFFETRNYVQRVLENAVVYDAMRAARGGTAPPPNRLSFYLGKRPG